MSTLSFLKPNLELAGSLQSFKKFKEEFLFQFLKYNGFALVSTHSDSSFMTIVLLMPSSLHYTINLTSYYTSSYKLKLHFAYSREGKHFNINVALSRFETCTQCVF